MYRVIPENLFYDEDVGDRAKLLYMELAHLGKKGQIPSSVTARFGGNRIDILMSQLKGYVAKFNNPYYELATGDIFIKREVKEEKEKANIETIKEIISYWNEVFNPHKEIRKTDKLVSMINARLSTFSTEEVKEAIRLRHEMVENNPWYRTEDGKRHKNRYDIVFRNDESLQKCLQADVSRFKKEETVSAVDTSMDSGFLD